MDEILPELINRLDKRLESCNKQLAITDDEFFIMLLSHHKYFIRLIKDDIELLKSLNNGNYRSTS